MTVACANLIAVATAVPRHIMKQTMVADRVCETFGGRVADFIKLSQIFDNCGITKRHTVRPVEWYLEDHSWPDRTEVYLEAACELFVAAARKAFDRAGLAAHDIDAIVTVSSTGIAAPSLEVRVGERLGLSAGVMRVPVFGLGCAGGVTGLAIAAKLAQARPGTNVLMVAVELCSLAIRPDKETMANIVALALFGDGAAAAIVRAGDGGVATIRDTSEYTWPDTLDIMGWAVEQHGFGVIFDRSIPPFAAKELAPAVQTILGWQGLERHEIGRFVCHPGGRKVIEAIEESLALETGTLDHERSVLSDYGNMSAPTALFVLERALQQGLPDSAVLMALGPGFTLSTATLGRMS